MFNVKLMKYLDEQFIKYWIQSLTSRYWIQNYWCGNNKLFSIKTCRKHFLFDTSGILDLENSWEGGGVTSPLLWNIFSLWTSISLWALSFTRNSLNPFRCLRSQRNISYYNISRNLQTGPDLSQDGGHCNWKREENSKWKYENNLM